MTELFNRSLLDWVCMTSHDFSRHHKLVLSAFRHLFLIATSMLRLGLLGILSALGLWGLHVTRGSAAFQAKDVHFEMADDLDFFALCLAAHKASQYLIMEARLLIQDKTLCVVLALEICLRKFCYVLWLQVLHNTARSTSGGGSHLILRCLALWLCVLVL